MIEKIRKAILENGLIKSGETVLAAFSGGADSTALLFALSALSKELGFSLAAAHYNHGIREEADADEAFCRETTEALSVPFYQEKGDVPSFAKANGLSAETAARLLRYDFLYRTAKKIGASSIATAHHAEDSAESILFHLVRGSGMAGLTGIKCRQTVDLSYADDILGENSAGEKKLELIRPMIGLYKAEILAFLAEKSQRYCTDTTNFIDDTARNTLRLRVLPLISEKINPAAVRNIVRTGEVLSEDEEFLVSLAKTELENARLEDGFDAKKLASLQGPVKKRCLRLALDEKATLVDIERTHIESLVSLLSMQSGASLDLPHSRARISFSKLVIDSAQSGGDKHGRAENEEFPLEIENGEQQTPFGRFKISVLSAFAMEKNGKEEYNTSTYIHCGKDTGFMDVDKLKGGLAVRTRKAGDRFRPVNSDFRMKLKDFFISRKVDTALRDSIPLVTCGGEIVFIPGFLVSDDVKITENTEKIIRIQYLGQ